MKDFDLDSHIDAASALLDLAIDDAYRPGVRQFLGVAAGMAALFVEAGLDDGELAPAPVYTPPDLDDWEAAL